MEINNIQQYKKTYIIMIIWPLAVAARYARGFLQTSRILNQFFLLSLMHRYSLFHLSYILRNSLVQRSSVIGIG
jgi:hypothetical protein